MRSCGELVAVGARRALVLAVGSRPHCRRWSRRRGARAPSGRRLHRRARRAARPRRAGPHRRCRAVARGFDRRDARSAKRAGAPFTAAFAAPLRPDQAVPVCAAAARCARDRDRRRRARARRISPARQWWLAPWWFVLASSLLRRGLRRADAVDAAWCGRRAGRAMYLTWLPSLVLAAVVDVDRPARDRDVRVVVAQLALPCAAVAAAITASGAWPSLARRTTSRRSCLTSRRGYRRSCSSRRMAAAAVALAVLARFVRSAFDRRSPPETPRSAPAAA